MRVLISGAGIAGPSLAWFLAKSGARVTVVEKSPALFPYGQNIDIQGSARKVVKKMGLLDEVLRFNTTEKGTQMIDPKGRPFAPFPVREDSDASPTSQFEILRGDFAALLYEATKNLPNVTYLFDTTVKTVVANNDEVVKVELSNGEVQDSDLLVAADGQWSKVRKQCFPPESVTVVDTGANVVYWTIPRLASDNDWWNVYLALGSRVVTLRPDPHNTIRAMFTTMPSDDAHKKVWLDAAKAGRQAQEALLRKEFADAGWQTQRLLDTLSQADDYYFHVVQQIKMSKWSSSRVVCLGDAGYAPTPFTGMGTSLAITGAYVLAGELSKLGPGEHPSKALEAYEAKFRPFVEETQKLPPFFPAIVHPGTAWKRWLFQTFIAVMSKVVANPWLANKLHSSNDDDFILPQYSSFDDEAVDESRSEKSS